MHRPTLLAVALVVALAGGAVATALWVIRVSDSDTVTGQDTAYRQVTILLHIYNRDAVIQTEPIWKVASKYLVMTLTTE